MTPSSEHLGRAAARPWHRPGSSTIAVALLVAAGAAWAGPPTVQSDAAVSSGEAYQACLRAASAAPRPSQAPAGNDDGRCAQQAAALSAAVLNENPDRPLFALSWVKTLQDAVAAETGAVAKLDRGRSTLLAQRQLP